MIDQYLQAVSIAKIAHAGQTDQAGEDYFKGHLTRVAATFEGVGQKAIALLHDVFEDTILDATDFRNLGINDRTIRAIEVVTRGEDETYGEYILRISNSVDHLAIALKIADLNDHLRDTTHISESLAKRYRDALELLKTA